MQKMLFAISNLLQIVFDISDPRRHYHIPLLLSPYGYTTYRGS